MQYLKKILVMAALLAMALAPQAARAEDNGFANALQLYYKAQWPEAAQAFQKVIEQNPQDSMALDYLIHCYIKRNDLRTVLYQLEQKTVATSEKDATALAHLGFGYLARSMREPNMLDEAQKTFEKSLTLDNNCAIAHCGIGLVYYQRRMMPRAKGHFLTALRHNPNDLMALERIGEITMVDERRPSEALTMFQTIMDKMPAYPDGYWYVGSANYDMGRYGACVDYMKKTIELDPSGLTQGYHAPMLMGKCYMKLKQYDDAKLAFNMALKLNPNNPEAKHFLEQSEHPPKN